MNRPMVSVGVCLVKVLGIECGRLGATSALIVTNSLINRFVHGLSEQIFAGGSDL